MPAELIARHVSSPVTFLSASPFPAQLPFTAPAAPRAGIMFSAVQGGAHLRPYCAGAGLKNRHRRRRTHTHTHSSLFLPTHPRAHHTRAHSQQHPAHKNKARPHYQAPHAPSTAASSSTTGPVTLSRNSCSVPTMYNAHHSSSRFAGRRHCGPNNRRLKLHLPLKVPLQHLALNMLCQ